jgi:magnesium chelatase subunit I
MPDLIEEVVERVAFEARDDKRIDKRSGVSQRMPITVMENVVSNAEQRALRAGDAEAVPRITDVYSALPAITGKIELEYEGELVGGATIARDLIRRACDATLRERAGDLDTDEIVIWFDAGRALQVADDVPMSLVKQGLATVPGLVDIVTALGLAPRGDDAMIVVACELVLEALVARRKISRNDAGTYGRAEREPRRKGGATEF